MDEEYVIHGPQRLKPLTKDSVGQLLYDALKENIKLPTAFVDAVTDKRISFKMFLNQSCRLAESLKTFGFTQNDVIAVCSENSLDFLKPVLAALYLGMTITMFNPRYTTREILHGANISKPAAIFCSQMTVDTILQVKKEMKTLRKIIVMETDEKHEDWESLQDFIFNYSSSDLDISKFKPVAVNTIEHVAFILYSSGTTGLPKGVMLTHNNITAILTLINDNRYFMRTAPGTDTGLGLMPLFHAYGLYVVLIGLIIGRSTVMLRGFDPKVFLKTIQDHKINLMFIAPPLANFLAKSPLVDKYDLSSIEVITCGAAPLSKGTENMLRKRFKLKIFKQSYGMTETTLNVTAFQINEKRAGSCGKLLAGVSAKVVNQSTGKTLRSGQIGEFYFKGDVIMKGYAGNVEATKDALDANGWLATGDVGYYDKDGFFYIVDRLKELIKYKGFQVPPAELEAVLLTHPKIEDAGVIGLPNEVAGELPLAFVVKKSDQELTEQEVVHFVAKQVSPEKQLRGGVKFVTEIPKNPSGKILRKELRKLPTSDSITQTLIYY